MPQRKDEYYEELAKIINLCQSIRTKGEDPFLIDIPQKLQLLRKLLPKWKLIEELLMDAEAMKELSLMVKLQSDWIKRKASGLFIDPFLIRAKISLMGKKELASAFLSSWHPIVSLEQLTSKKLEEALDYWRALIPLSQRLKELEEVRKIEESTLSISDLMKLKFLSDRTFEEELLRMKEELKNLKEPIDYWKFVVKEDYESTILRAYILSFIISEGYVDLMFNPIEERILILPSSASKKKTPRSFPIAVNYEKWMEKKNERRG
ncbi:MAG: hypothetical protein NZ922_01780 [Candidatus Methanomethyliaceae archaeon]|nr:hypothetical protein [Candidatus Methanomethyliaceae archaeon]MDW7970800.1 hypothetical protein [Nitrososphaerota archaeon]